MPRLRNATHGVLAVAAACTLTACVEERVVAVRGGLHSLEGVDSELKLEARSASQGGTTWDALIERYYPGTDQRELGEPAPGYPNRRLMPDGAYILVSRSPHDLIVHLYETLVAGEFHLMYTQLVADRTKQAYLKEGRNPEEAGKYLVSNRKQVTKLLGLMPAAESTPGVYLKPTDRKSYTLSVPNAQAVSSKFSELEFAIEDGRFVLVVIR